MPIIFTLYCFLQDYSKEAVAHVQMFLMKNEVPVNLFEVSVSWNQLVCVCLHCDVQCNILS